MNERDIQSRLKKVWGATGMPFAPTSRCDYQSPAHYRLREEWLRWIELGASGVVSGDHGIGKSIMLQKVKETLSPKLYSTVVLTHTSLSAADLLTGLALALGVEASSTRRSRTARVINETWQKEGRKPVLIIDEAQNLSTAALEEVRLLMCASAQNGQREVLTLSLCGDRELLDKLRMGVNAPLLSRLGYQLHIEALSEEEVEAYLQARFAEVGVFTLPLDPGTVPLIHKACGGNPRKINQLLQQALLILLETEAIRLDTGSLQKALQKVPSLQLSRKNTPSSSA